MSQNTASKLYTNKYENLKDNKMLATLRHCFGVVCYIAIYNRNNKYKKNINGTTVIVDIFLSEKCLNCFIFKQAKPLF